MLPLWGLGSKRDDPVLGGWCVFKPHPRTHAETQPPTGLFPGKGIVRARVPGLSSGWPSSPAPVAQSE